MSSSKYLNTHLVVGAGISGASIARLIAEELNEKVLVIDKKDFVAGNCFDYRDSNGIMIHKYGSHIFHTDDENIWKFVKKFSSFNTYMHKVVCVIDGIRTHIPFNIDSLYDVFPRSLAQRLEEKLLKRFKYNSRISILDFSNEDDEDLKFLSEFIYDKVFLEYSQKQWGKDPKSIDGSVSARVPVIVGKDDRYFKDRYQGIPLEGYTSMVDNMLNHPNIKLRLNTDYKDFISKEIPASCRKNEVDVGSCFKSVVYTGSIDEFFNYKFGILPYRSVSFKFETFNRMYYQENAVVNYPCNYDFTRIHEYKYYLSDVSSCTVIAKEYSSEFKLEENDRFYPVSSKESLEMYEKYLNLIKGSNIHLLGRLGNYKYYDMDEAVEASIKLFKEQYK